MNTEAVKNRLRKQGKSIKQWALEKGVPEAEYVIVIRLMNGFSKGKRGISARVAAQLGLL
jgi:gp16 family phage-associated protein